MATPSQFLRLQIDTTATLRKAEDYKRQAQKADFAIIRANRQLATEFQKAEAEELRKQIQSHGRPQRRSWQGSPLRQALESERNRQVDADGFEVNDPQFLDSTVMHWRQLEEGAQGNFQILSGLFQLPFGKTSAELDSRARFGADTQSYLKGRAQGAGGRFVKAGTGQSGGRQSSLERPIAGSRTAVRFRQFRGRGAVTFDALVGPRDPYRYIERTTEETLGKWQGGHVARVYRNAFSTEGLNLLAEFQFRGGSVS